jgi:TolB protein
MVNGHRAGSSSSMIRRISAILGAAAAIGAIGAFAGCGELAAPEPGVPLETPGTRPLAVTNVTTGGAFDVDGFQIALDGSLAGPTDLNETVSLWNLTSGPHTVALTGVAPNCKVDAASQIITIGAEPTEPVRFEVVCTAPSELASLRVLFARRAWSAAAPRTSMIAAMNADGGGRIQLTSGSFNDYGPDPSPDGSRILFMRDDPNDGAPLPDIHLITVDGSNEVLLRGPAYDPDWSPAGDHFAFIAQGSHWGGPVMVARSDGAGVIRLTGQNPLMEEASPAWSPDGKRLAFVRVELGPGGASGGVWVMNADGSNATQISGVADRPVWSPDGKRIAFSDTDARGNSRIVSINADGSALGVQLRVPSVSRLAVDDWSADGRFLLFSAESLRSPRSDLYLLDLRTGATTRLTADGVYNIDGVFWHGEPEQAPAKRNIRDEGGMHGPSPRRVHRRFTRRP